MGLIRQAVLIALLSLMIFSCGTPPRITHERLNATLWAQESAEYRIVTQSIYANAVLALEKALEDTNWTAYPEQKANYQALKPAIILDIDETVLDNTPYHAALIKENHDFDLKRWNRWLISAVAEPIAGSVDFLNYAKSKGVEVFFVTNRDTKLEQFTKDNLKKRNFPLNDQMDTVLSRFEQDAWTADKQVRFASIAQNYRVLLMFGDELNDFITVKDMSPDQRKVAAEAMKDYWGKKWFMMPNPNYGSWIEIITSKSLSDEDRLKSKYDTLKPAPQTELPAEDLREEKKMEQQKNSAGEGNAVK